MVASAVSHTIDRSTVSPGFAQSTDPPSGTELAPKLLIEGVIGAGDVVALLVVGAVVEAVVDLPLEDVVFRDGVVFPAVVFVGAVAVPVLTGGVREPVDAAPPPVFEELVLLFVAMR